jgi:hypothetical protein
MNTKHSNYKYTYYYIRQGFVSKAWTYELRTEWSVVAVWHLLPSVRQWE